MPEIFIHPSLAVRRSPIGGFGVFASAAIAANTEIERAYHILFPLNSDCLFDYRFNWPKKNKTHYSVALGFGSIYNHASDSNADWRTDLENKVFVFYTVRDVAADEELLINYGGAWWDRRNYKNQV